MDFEISITAHITVASRVKIELQKKQVQALAINVGYVENITDLLFFLR